MINEKKWEKSSIISSKIGDSLINRVYYVDNLGSPKYKYKEELSWESTMNKTCICIGFNPAKANACIDDTNERIISKMLISKYCGYTLLNIYPEITDKADMVHKTDKENVKFINYLINLLKTDKRDVLLFFGVSANVPVEFANVINGIIDRVYISTLKGEFRHPGSLNSDYKMTKLENEYFRVSIRINNT